jgi:cytochrome c-type biogenesis protein CcmF
MIASAFLAFLLLASNPFARIDPAPTDGLDLNPLLQDPGLALHPPFLYLGYVGLSLVFAFAVAGLIGGRIDEMWARLVRPWALIAWTFLTIGIALGSWWAYYELGWGGFWAWDPVENASFMPWLAATALIHSLRATEVRGAFRAWTALLAILAFSLSLIGTFLVRSGVLTSVHAFAVDPLRGVFILLILALAIGGSLALYSARAHKLGEGAPYDAVSRESALLVNNLVLTAACATVFVGTFYPLFLEAASGEKISVGAPYFAIVFPPFALLSLLLMAPGARLSWRRAELRQTLRRLKGPALAGLAASVIAFFMAAPKSAPAILAAGFAACAGAAVIFDLAARAREGGLAGLRRLPRRYFAMSAAHFGIAVVAFGAIGAGAWKSETVAYVNAGQSIEVGAYQATLRSVDEIAGPNYAAARAVFDVSKGAQSLGSVIAERRFYPVRGMQTTEAGIQTGLAGDIYLTVGEFRDGKGYIVRAWRHPFALFLWIGAALMALGGVIALAPGSARARQAAARPVAAEGVA